MSKIVMLYNETAECWGAAGLVRQSSLPVITAT